MTAGWQRVWGWLSAVGAVAATLCAAAEHWLRSRLPREWTVPTRAVLLGELARAERGEARVEEEEAMMAGSEEVVARTTIVRGTRAPRTDAAAGRAVRLVREFVEANPRLLSRPRGAPTHATYDVVVEAFVFSEEARVAGDACPWQSARRPGDASAARTAGAARAALERLGWSRGSEWRRSRAMGKAWGVNDPEDVTHFLPIFVWELVEGLRLAPSPSTPWEMCGVAMAVLSALGARRGGGASMVKVGEISILSEDAVEVAPRARPKQHRARATKRPRKQARPVVLRHWLVRAHVIPWLQWHQRRKSPASALLFPGITTVKSRAASAQGFTADGQWIEPLKEWSPRQRAALLQRYVPNLGRRSFHGFRSGNQCELRRWSDVSAVTRRALHERSIRHLIGSEAAYDEVFAEDFATAVQRLGRLRIERTRQGLLTVVASSASAGEEAGDWTPLPGGVIPIGAEEEAAVATAAQESSDSASESGESAVGDGGRDTRVMTCGRCGRKIGARDYGYLCDEDGCTWGACTTCHPGGARAPLRCPRHSSTR